MSARRVALKVLSRIDRDKSYSNLTLDSELKKTELNDSDRALASCIVFGVVARKITLDYYISRLTKVAESKIEPQVRNILRMGLYQMMYLDRIPDHAAVNESVNAAPKRAKSFVNAVLRRFLRERDTVAMPTDPIMRLSVEESYPVELSQKLADSYGLEVARDILAAMNTTPPTTLRVNTLKTDRETLLSEFSKRGVEAERGRLTPDSVYVRGTPVTELYGFEDRLFFVQDEASQICVSALDAKPDSLVVDCCSAPGSKSFGAAMTMKNRGKILSFDLHENKLSLIRSGATSLGIDIIEANAADAREFIPELEGKADAVLCDVPCSGYGVIAKKPEIRFKPISESEKLPQIQYAILENCSRYVKDGGVLVYSTCTVLPEENKNNTDRFLVEHPEFESEEITLNGKKYTNGIQLLPNIHGTDGFYIAKFRKRLGR